MKKPDHPPALSAVLYMVRERALGTSVPEDLMALAMNAGIGDEQADRSLTMLLRATAVGNKGAAAGKVWPADGDILIAMSIRDGLRAAVAGEAAEEPAPTLRQTIIVNGQSVQVPRGPYDHVPGVAVRAVQMAGFDTTRDWEIKDGEGEVLGYKDNPDRIRYVSLPAGTAS